MNTFLVGINLQEGNAKFVLDKISRITREISESFGIKPEVSKELFPEIRGGWFYFTPNLNPSEKLITEYVDKELAVLVYGELFFSREENAANLVLRAWKEGGVDSVRELDGSFSAVIIDFRLRKAYILCDLLGSRSLRYLKHKNSLFISNHDIPLVATGHCPIQYNLVSMCSITAFDWSLGGESLLQPIDACHPNEYISWENGVVRRHSKPSLILNNPPLIERQESDHEKIEEMIEHIQKDAKGVCGKNNAVSLHLTAGLDTRSILGILISQGHTNLIAETLGEANYLDVLVARRIAKRYSFKHRNYVPDSPANGTFLKHVKLKAFLMNGDTDSKRAIWPMEEVNNRKIPCFHGAGGEIFAIPNLERKNPFANLTKNDIFQILLEQPMCRYHSLDWISKDMKDGFLERFENILSDYYKMTSSNAEVTDLFYLYERMSRWAAMVERTQWRKGQIITLFRSPKLIRLGYRLSVEARFRNLLENTIVKSFLPGIYNWPFNWGEYLSKPSKAAIIKNYLYSDFRGIPAKIRKAIGLFQKNSRSIDKIEADFFADHLGELLHGTLLSKKSLSLRIFTPEFVRKIIEEHIAKKKNHISLLGPLLTIEQWGELVNEASEAANE